MTASLLDNQSRLNQASSRCSDTESLFELTVGIYFWKTELGRTAVFLASRGLDIALNELL
jgi:hypothetical protein